jgi:hypothetical protein
MAQSSPNLTMNTALYILMACNFTFTPFQTFTFTLFQTFTFTPFQTSCVVYFTSLCVTVTASMEG